MGLRFRKSVKIAPGVKVNFGKKSASVTVGTKGAKITTSTTGRRTTSVGIPGTGVSYVTTNGRGNNVDKKYYSEPTDADYNENDQTYYEKQQLLEQLQQRLKNAKINVKLLPWVEGVFIACFVILGMLYPICFIGVALGIAALVYTKKNSSRVIENIEAQIAEVTEDIEAMHRS